MVSDLEKNFRYLVNSYRKKPMAIKKALTYPEFQSIKYLNALRYLDSENPFSMDDVKMVKKIYNFSETNNEI
jgi:hypothetical protein